jgi:hypothetical protein
MIAETQADFNEESEPVAADRSVRHHSTPSRRASIGTLLVGKVLIEL